jgi:hypothetical protein
MLPFYKSSIPQNVVRESLLNEKFKEPKISQEMKNIFQNVISKSTISYASWGDIDRLKIRIVTINENIKIGDILLLDDGNAIRPLQNISKGKQYYIIVGCDYRIPPYTLTEIQDHNYNSSILGSGYERINPLSIIGIIRSADALNFNDDVKKTKQIRAYWDYWDLFIFTAINIYNMQVQARQNGGKKQNEKKYVRYGKYKNGA